MFARRLRTFYPFLLYAISIVDEEEVDAVGGPRALRRPGRSFGYQSESVRHCLKGETFLNFFDATSRNNRRQT